MAASTSDAKTYKFLGGGDGQNVGLGMVFNLLKEKISGLGVEGIKSTVKDLESDVNTLQENVGLRDDVINEHGKILDSLTKPTYTTYAKLKELVVGKKLNVLSTYIITDYLPVLSSTYSQTAQSTDKSQFALMLIANTNSTFFHECLAVDLAKDNQSNLSIANVRNLKILYDFNNDKNKYDWIADGIGNGVIYRMIDEYGNDCPYDFYNIKFKFGDVYYYTFSEISNDTDVNFCENAFTNCHIETLYKIVSVVESHIKPRMAMTLPQNYISKMGQDLLYDIHDIYIKGTSNKIKVDTKADGSACKCNNIEIQSDGVNIDTRNGSQAADCENISIGVGCVFSKATISGSNIKIGNGCVISGSISGSNIKIGNNCQINSIRGNNIKIGDNCTNIQIGTSDVSGSNITIGNNCQADLIIGEFIRLEDGVILKYPKDIQSGQITAFPLYNVSFKSGNGETPITLQLENGFSIGENVKIGDCVFYLGTFYNSDGSIDNNKTPYTFRTSDWNGNQSYIKMVYPNEDMWITEIKKK